MENKNLNENLNEQELEDVSGGEFRVVNTVAVHQHERSAGAVLLVVHLYSVYIDLHSLPLFST